MNTTTLDKHYKYATAIAVARHVNHDPEEVRSLVHDALADAGFDTDPAVQRQYIRRKLSRYRYQVSRQRRRYVSVPNDDWDNVPERSEHVPVTSVPSSHSTPTTGRTCRQGHALTPDNLDYKGQRWPRCKTCRRLYQRRWHRGDV